MNWSTPNFSTRSLFSTLPLVITVNPFALAIGIAIPPTPPVPPEMKIVFPDSAPISSKACIIVNAVNGTAAASSSVK